MKNIVYQVTWKHMKMNRKRTWTMFLGIFFMVLLMTCVFVGKKTAVSYLQETGAQKKGKWHASMYDVTEKELEKVQNLSYIRETAKSADYGYTDFDASGNSMRPYLYVKAYESPCFDWMNLKLKEGRFPENGKEIVISQSAIEDGAQIATGDSIKVRYFDRFITGTAKGVTTTFPFQDLTVTYGETMKVSQDFPFFDQSYLSNSSVDGNPDGGVYVKGSDELFTSEETDSFRIDKKYIGEETELTVVGILETPWFEQRGSAGYSAFTYYEADKKSTFNLSMVMDLKSIPANVHQELWNIAGDLKVEFNNYVLSFSGNSSDSVVNFIVNVMSAFFMIVIMTAAIILIYNVFNISFEERSRYLGMLCSVGATGRQKRSSVYFEAFSLFLPALPLGILAGCLVVWIGMSLFQPFIYTMMSIPAELLEKVPVHLQVSYKELLMIMVISALTVFLSALLPAKKISKIGPIECIRGNLEKESGRKRKNLDNVSSLSAERLLARNSLRHQKRKTKGMRRAAATFMVILIITVSGAQMITKLVTYRMVERGTERINNKGWDYQLSMVSGSRKEYEAMKSEVRDDPGVEAVKEQYYGTFLGEIPNDTLSLEYWKDVRRVFNLYYHRELSDQEFQEHFSSGYSGLNIVAVEKDVFEEIAKATDTDMALLEKNDTPCAIVVQNGEVSTENWGVGGMTPEKFEFYEVEKMTDMEKGDELPVTLYSPKQDAGVEFPLCIAGFATNKQLEDYFDFHSEILWVIVELETGDRMDDILMDDEDGYNMMVRTLYLRMNEKSTDLLQRLNILTEPDDSGWLLSPAEYTKTIAEAMNSIIRILLAGFVVLTSVICLLNLYNSIHGWISEQRRHFAMMVSIGMTQKQIKKMLFYEAGHLMAGSSIWAVAISTPLIIGLKKCLITRFGYVNFAFPWWIYITAIFTAAIVIFAFMLYHYHREKGDLLRAVFMV